MEKSALAKPVVVVIETTWKTPWRIAASPCGEPVRPELGDERDRGDGEDAEIEAELLIRGRAAPATADERAVDEREVDPGDDHEHDHDPLRGGSDSVSDACVGVKPPVGSVASATETPSNSPIRGRCRRRRTATSTVASTAVSAM